MENNTVTPPNPATTDATTALEDFVDRRIESQEDIGTVKYHGPLLHQDDKQDPNQIWLGIQWDNATRGRHNGTVKGAEYFLCDDGRDSGSLLKVDKVNFGINIYDGILMRYFHNQQQQTQEPAATTAESGEEKSENYVNDKGIAVEYDQEAYFETVRKFKKKVEFLGFDRIWKKINDLKNILELSLPGCKISDIGPDGSLQKLLPSVKNLSLEANLIYDWNQIFLIGRELKDLEQLSISNNILKLPQQDVQDLQRIYVNSNDTFINEPPKTVFANLKTIILISMRLTWKQLNKVIALFLDVEDLVLCFNRFTDFENLTYEGSDFKNLKFLNLEGNELTNFDGVKKFGSAPNLEKLTLSQNKLKELGKFDGFTQLNNVAIEDNEISEFYIFSQMNCFPKLETIRVTKNPIYNKHSPLHIRQRAIAEIKNLKYINGSELKKYERKDCEIYYLRNTFQEFFTKTNQTAEKYDYNQFIDYCASEHPRIPELIQVFGNPYEDSLIHGGKTEEEAQKNKSAGFVSVKLSAFSGAALGKPATVKKFTSNTLVTNLKAMLTKQFGIPANKQKVYYKADPHDPFSQLEEDLKDLAYYGVKNGGEIWVGDHDL